MKKVFSIAGAPAPIGPYSQAVQVGSIVYISGQICIDPFSGHMNNADIQQETQQVMQNIMALLEAAGAAADQVVKCSIFLKDLEDFSVVNAVYARFFSPPFPARECVEVSRLPKDVRVEISAIAVLD